jgi:hypothetical protein
MENAKRLRPSVYAGIAKLAALQRKPVCMAR